LRLILTIDRIHGSENANEDSAEPHYVMVADGRHKVEFPRGARHIHHLQRDHRKF